MGFLHEMPSESSTDQVRDQIKKWERDFKKKHERLPAKDDIKKDLRIHQLYKTYRARKSRDVKSEKIDVKSEPAGKEDTVTKNNIIEVNLSESEEVDGEVKVEMEFIGNTKVELGPTPQANGKVLSIFDFGMTPPESSPLKDKVVNGEQKTDYAGPKQNPDAESPFKTPTKIKISTNPAKFNERGSRTGGKLFSKLKMAQVETPRKNSAQAFSQADYLQTPQYLSNATRKFIVDSPLSKRGTPCTINERSVVNSQTQNINDPFLTPTKSTSVNFSISPSPLKPHRFLTKKLSDVFNDLKTLQETTVDISNTDDEKIEQEKEEAESKGDEDKIPKVKKKFTQKRTTRRWKIKPKTEDEGIGKIRNVHKEIARIDKRAHQNMVDYINSDHGEDQELGDEEDEELESFIAKAPSDVSAEASTKGKRKPLSMNFQRAKINDPRIKKFKRFMKNR